MRKRQRLFVATMAVVLIAALFASCTNSANGKNGSLAQFSEPVKGQQVAVIEVKDFGEIQVMLFPEAAPKGVENFVTHAKNGYYDGVKFHRVIKDFMIQGGDPEGTGMGGESIWGEGFAVEYDGTLRNFTGALAYANAGPGTNGSQFFIVHSPAVTAADMENYVTQMDDGSGTAVKFPDDVQAKYKEVGGAPYLDGGYTVFGQVYQGLDIVQKIMETETGMDDFGMEQSVPMNDVIIETITVSEYAG